MRTTDPPAPLIVAYLVFAAGHVLASFPEPTRLWAWNALAFTPPAFRIAWFVLAALLVVPAVPRLVARFAPLLPGSGSGPLRAVPFAIAGLVVALAFRNRNLFFGDSALIPSVLADTGAGVAGTAGGGSFVVHRAVHAALGAFGVSPEPDGAALAFVTTSILAGIVVLLAWFSLTRDRPATERLASFSLLAGSGVILLFFGTVEHYPLMQLFAALYLIAGVRARTFAGECLALGLLLVAAFFHWSALALAPAWVALVWPRVGGKAARGALVALTAVAAVAAGAALFRFGRAYEGWDALVPLLRKGKHAYTVFSIEHVRFVMNELLLITGPLALLFFLPRATPDASPEAGESGAGEAMIARASGRAVERFLGCAVLFGLLFLLAVEPWLGPRDWDLMAIPAFPLLVWGVRSLLRRRVATAGASGLLFGAALLHAGPWVVANASEDRAVALTIAWVEHDPHYENPIARAPKALGVLLSRRGHDAAAGALFAKATQIREDAQDFFNRGTNLAKQGDYEGAVEWLLRAIESEPTYLEARYNLARAEWKRGNHAAAETSLRLLLSIEPNHGKAEQLLGTVLSEVGDEKGAIEALRRSVEADSTSWEAWANLGVLLAKSGAEAEAREAFGRSLAINGGNATVRAYYERLGGSR